VRRGSLQRQAGVYSAAAHYLEAIKAIGTDDADKVSAEMRRTKINDFMTHDGWISGGRPDHARRVHFQQVKSPEGSKYPFDYFKTVATIPAREAWCR
jgi:branched-chain amino acid transport system substrate-binding protein